jgi:hypothetical protein
MKVFYLFLFVILIAGCSQSDPKPISKPAPNIEAESSYVDYINIGDKHYLNAWELALIDTNGITVIGEVERGLVIPQGTLVYEIPGYPEDDVVAVKADSNNVSN